MRLVIVSDTHGLHEELGVLSGDVLIHCGDFEDLFNRDDRMLDKVDDWFGRQNVNHILCVGGNHDFLLEDRLRGHAQPFRNAMLLHDAGCTINGWRFYGSSWVPKLSRHAFFADDRKLADAWAQMPAGIDVLITHTPPAGILDRSSRGLELGCAHLSRRLEDLRPRLHCFGHVHASAGNLTRSATRYVNATSVNSDIQIAYPPFQIDLTHA